MLKKLTFPRAHDTRHRLGLKYVKYTRLFYQFRHGRSAVEHLFACAHRGREFVAWRCLRTRLRDIWHRQRGDDLSDRRIGIPHR